MKSTLLLLPLLVQCTQSIRRRSPRLRGRELEDGTSVKKLSSGFAFGNPCTGSWSNDYDPEKEDIICPTDPPTNNELECDLRQPSDDAFAPAEPTRITFFFAVENIDNSTDWLPTLENKIFGAISEELNLCTAESEAGRLRKDKDQSDRRRKLKTLDSEEVQRARALGVVGLSSSPDDVIRDDRKLLHLSCQRFLLF